MHRPSKRRISRKFPQRGRLSSAIPCIEPLEDRILLSAVSWSSTSSGSWNTAGNWSTGAVPGSGDIVTINQPGVQVALSGIASVTSLTITSGSLAISGGTLSDASNLTIGSGGSLSLSTSTVSLPAGASVSNLGSITVNPGSQLKDGGAYTETSGANLTLPSGTLSTGVGANLVNNPGFESPTAVGGTTLPDVWGQWNSTYVSTAYAHTLSQSLVESGSNAGVDQSFSVTPGVGYSGSAWALDPSTANLTGAQGLFYNLSFSDAGGNTIGSPSVFIPLVTANSALNTWINSKTGILVAPANAVKANLYIQIGPYSGLSGTSGGSAYLDDVAFGPTAVNSASVTATSISNSGNIGIGAGDVVSATGAFTQTGTGNLSSLLGGPAASNLYGSLTAGGAATLAGTLSATVAGSYSPSVNDGFNLLSYASLTGGFSSIQLPSSGSYTFQSSVNPTYVGISALPTSLSTTISASTKGATATNNLVGVNIDYWDNLLTTPQTQSMVEAAGLSLFRFPGGSASDDFHFNVANNYNDSAAITIPQFAQFITQVGGAGIVTTDYGSGSPQEAEAELAYLGGSTSDTTVIGNGIEWNDSTGAWQTVNWQTVGYWAGLRAATPLGTDDGLNFLRLGQAAPFSNINDWEIGNEEYGNWEIDHHGTAGPGGVSTGAQHDPATYAKFAAAFADFDAGDTLLPAVKFGIDSGDPSGASDGNWTQNVITDLHNSYGLAPGFISDHSYVQGPGSESDSYLLNDTVSDPASISDWSTRYADYETMLQSVLGTGASSVKIMATEFNSNYGVEGKQMGSLVNGLFIADSIGSMLNAGYTGGLVWDLRNGWTTDGNNSPSLYGWREGGDEGILGSSNINSPPTTGPYIPYPSYFGEQLASKIMLTGGSSVSTVSNYAQMTVYSVLEPNGHLELMVINKNPDASITEPFSITGFAPSGQAQIWQYGETQDYAQSQSTTGASALANFSTTVALTGNNFSYTFSPYSMTVIDLSPAAPPVASAFQVNDGSAQRAMVTSLTVTFNEPVTLASNAITLNLLSQTGGASTPVSFVVTSKNGGAAWVLTFTDASDVGGSLPDGAYELSVNAGGVTSTQGIAMTSSQNFTFWRLYGDFEGTGEVNGSDFSLFAAHFGSNANSTDWYLDYNGDGSINGTDFGQFASRFGKSISIPTVPSVLQTADTTDALGVSSGYAPTSTSNGLSHSKRAIASSHRKSSTYRQ
jgi:hypothetical protein